MAKFHKPTALGFTLLEILIAVTILAIISTLTAVNISKSIKFKNKIEQDLDDYSAVRDALVIITHDVNTAFHWVDINAEMTRQIMAAASATPAPPPAGGGGNAIPIERLTAFMGETDSLYLTTLSHTRTVMNTQESDQAKIGYYLKDVKALHGGQNTKALIRSEGVYLDGEAKKGGKETVLLENIKTFKLKYMGGDDKEWLENWKSIETDDDSQKNKFPDAVDITLTTVRNGREVTLSTIASVHNTFNDLLNSLSGSPSGSPHGSPAPAPTPTPH